MSIHKKDIYIYVFISTCIYVYAQAPNLDSKGRGESLGRGHIRCGSRSPRVPFKHTPAAFKRHGG